ncbi:MAG: DUF4402 domain-containing protein [Anaeroplasmataceae bacterium]
MLGLNSVHIMASEATMTVTAHVIETLTIVEDESMDFGNIYKGTQNSAKGIFGINGEPGANVEVAYPRYVKLLHNTNKKELMSVELTDDHDVFHTLGEDGVLKFTVEGTLYAEPNQLAGAYSGEFVASVRYK